DVYKRQDSNEYDIEKEKIDFNSPKKYIFKVMNKISKEYNYFRAGEYLPANYNNDEINNFVNFCDRNSIDCIIFNQGNMITLIQDIKKKLKRKNVKIISWVHSNYDIYENKYFKKCKNSLKKGIESSDAVICLTSTDEKEYQKLNKWTYCIPNPLTIHSNERSQLTNKSIILTTRVNYKTKGIDFLFPIARELPESWDISIAGPMSKIAKIQTLYYSLKYKTFGKIKFLGSKRGEGLINHYLSGSIFLSTSRWEGFGLSITEAMSLGLPIISFDTMGPAYILDNGKYGIIIDKYDVNEMSKKIKLLINDENLKEKYASLAYERSKDFTIEKIYIKWEEIFKKIEMVKLNES
ncbi:glycosyltransferase, partial [Enterococcus hirae]